MPNDLADRLPPKCPTCGSEDPTTYYGSCFDNQHDTIFDPRLPLDPWHTYMNALWRLLNEVDSLNTYVAVGREMLERAGAERDEARRQLDTLRNAIEEQVRELRAVHRPQWASSARGYTTEPRDGYDPVGCVECCPHDGSWPCITAEVADALAAAGDGVPEEGA